MFIYLNKINLVFIFLLLFTKITFSEIEIRISTDKNEYLEGETIIFNISFFNNSDQTDSVNSEMLQLFYIKVIDSDNEKSTFVGSVGDRIGILFLKIKPYESVGQSIILNNHFVNVIFIPRISSARGYLKNNLYKINYSYYEMSALNDVEIRISEPKGKEKEVFDSLLAAYSIDDSRWVDIDSLYIKQKLFYQIASNNPESVYWEEAVYRYNQMCNWLNLAYSDINLNKKFIEKLPNSIHMQQVLINLCRSIYYYDGGEPAVIQYLEQIIQSFPDSKASISANSQLKNKGYLK